MRNWARRVLAASSRLVGVEEVAIYLALGLMAAGCWQVWAPGACLVPGAVMLWMYLPQRQPFITRPPAPIARRKP
jgi:hypothetical protein